MSLNHRQIKTREDWVCQFLAFALALGVVAFIFLY